MIVIIGGGIVGTSTAFHLANMGAAKDVIVVEPDPTYELAATTRSSGGVRRMFSIPECIEMSKYAHDLFDNFHQVTTSEGKTDYDINFRKQGYLWIGSGTEQVNKLFHNWSVHTKNNVNVELLGKVGLNKRFPSMNTNDIDVGLFGPDEGFVDPHAALMGLRSKAIQLGVQYIVDKVVDFEINRKKIISVKLDSGRCIRSNNVVNAANCWGIDICESLGMKVPVHPIRRMTYYYETKSKIEALPSIRHIGSNVHFRPEGQGYITGSTNYAEKPGFNWDLDHAWFEEEIWPDLANRFEAFEAIKVFSAWSGHYDQNYIDNNAIIDRWSGVIDNFFIALGFSGHGFQHGPATGRGLAELILLDRFVSLDLAPFSYKRFLEERPLLDIGPFA